MACGLDDMFEKILVAIDDSDRSRSIFDRSLVLAKARRFIYEI
jgi:nucleotide-binding universal stress UspA family protein